MNDVGLQGTLIVIGAVVGLAALAFVGNHLFIAPCQEATAWHNYTDKDGNTYRTSIKDECR